MLAMDGVTTPTMTRNVEGSTARFTGEGIRKAGEKNKEGRSQELFSCASVIRRLQKDNSENQKRIQKELSAQDQSIKRQVVV